ncbi:piggyBac transposable element-derived protein 4-like [Cydia splendana]|uniref:piggyBac transposable element-derived protein 4-like n=1 Tax=Cydia splendana TaxID=1100963 RepID=UPI00300D6039
MRVVDELSDCDMDVDQDDEAVNLLPNMPARDALAEPAIEADLTDFEAQVLLAEDRQNDLALREIVPRADYNFEWDKDRRIFKGQRETFTASSGPTFPITDQTRAVDIFYKMCDSDLLDRLCLETNRYASQKITLLKTENKLLPNSRLQRWTPIDKDEMISFLALTILQGLYPLPDEESYFSFNGFGSMPYFSRIMSYNRYFLIKSLLHFVDNQNLTEPTKLSKIQPITDYFNEKFSSLYYPGQEIAIDESLLKWHGRLGFAQKILSKAAQVGVKTYELCESSSGYLWIFFVYAGKTKPTNTPPVVDDMTGHVQQHAHDMTGPEIDTTDSTDRPTTATVKIVYDLVEPLLNKGHTLIMDNFYNSPLLVRCLKRQKTDCYGTLRLNREFVPDSLKTLNQLDLRRGEVVASYCSDLSVIVWRDANIVSLISTYHSLQVGTKTKYNGVYKPSIVLDYNKSMGGVDKKDQYLSAHPLERCKNKVWYKKLFRRMFNAAIFNCFVIFATSNPKINQRQFRIMLAEDLLKIHRQIDLTDEKRLITRRSGLTTKTSTVRPKTHQRPQLEHRHFPTRTGFKQSRCWMCAQRKATARTVWKCMECDVNLCIEHCFMNYHIKPSVIDTTF